MFDVSWGELLVVTGLGFALVGKKDLPKAAGFVGTRVGRVVGLLQGARARADSFAQQTELQQLHNELKSGLRELDAVKSEMAVAMSSRGMRGIGPSAAFSSPTTMSSRTVLKSPQPQPQQVSFGSPGATAGPTSPPAAASTSLSSTSILPSTSNSISAQHLPTSGDHHQSSPVRALPPPSQTIGAVAEDEWDKQGIGFRSRAERGVGLAGYNEDDANNPLNSGSSILANIYKHNLIFDQYDRVVQEQDEILQSKMDSLKAQRAQDKQDKKQS